ncbi:Bacterial ribosome SSU maturation protein RimP [hydrothermal vent metagenome]|uniref:Bacterial ribosome SSU maturation protein RimP n=1 Tax=hydrothermal vent metagenome TaxID=652676 RepID=A0A3B0Y6W8_9ZZZZ
MSRPVSGLRENLQELLRPGVEALGFELVGIDFQPREKNSLIRLYIESKSDKGILLEDCAAVSRQVSGILEVEEPIAGRFTLEVSSPGLDRPLFEMSHFKRFLGQKSRVKMMTEVEGRKNFTGVIQAVSDSTVTLIVDETEFELIFDDIKSARLVPKY